MLTHGWASYRCLGRVGTTYKESGFFLILYFCSIKLRLKSWPSNSFPWSYVISTGHVYQTTHVVSTKFAIIIAFLLLYIFISHHLVTGYIIVTYFNIICSLHFIRIHRALWDLHIVYSAVFLLLIYQAIYRLFGWSFFTLAHATLSDFLTDSFSTARPVQMLANNCLCSILSRMK